MSWKEFRVSVEFLTQKHFDDLDMRFIFDRIQVISPYGKEAKSSLKPFLTKDHAMLTHRYHLIEQTLERIDNKRYEILEIQGYLKEVKQLKHTFERLESEATLSVTELFEIKFLAIYMKRIKEVLDQIKWAQTVGDFELKSTLPIIELLDPDGNNVNNFHIYSSYSQDLYNIRLQMETVEQTQKRHLKACIERLKESGLKVTANGDVRINKSDVDLLNCAQKSTDLIYQMDMAMYSLYKVKSDPVLEGELESLKVQEEAEEERVRNELSRALSQLLPLLLENTMNLGAIDLLIATAQFCKAFGLKKPVIRMDDVTKLEGARHLKVETALRKENKTFIPIDIELSQGVTVITGANMGGKTVSLRTLGQAIAMAQYGLFVPCHNAEISLFDFLFVSVGDAQNIDMGLSTFGAEMVAIGQILKHIESKGLILIDELARGTNPKEGYAISKALIDYLKTGKSNAVITTHYDGLTSDEGVAHYQVNGLKNIALDTIKEAVQKEGIQLLHELMDYRLTKIDNDVEIPKEAIRIAELMGLDQAIVLKAKGILGGA